MEIFDYGELVRATDGFSSLNLIGRGSHGSVYRASLAGSGACRRTVAVKRVTLTSHGESYQKLSDEIATLSSLPPHPHVVRLLGSAAGRPSVDDLRHHPPPLLVMEFMGNGSLHGSLHESPEPPSWPTRFSAALHVARALEFLHQRSEAPPVIHRDVKSANVLFDKDWNAKLSDFGLAATADGTPNPAGTIGYIDPSYTCASKLSTKNDIFSFGVLVLEILSGRKPIDVSKEPASILDWASSLTDKRRATDIRDPRVPLPAASEDHFQQLLRLAMHCSSPEESCRPTARELVVELERGGAPERVIRRVPATSWTSPLWSMVVLSRQRWKLAKKCRGCGPDRVGGCLPRRKLSLREVLSGVTLEEEHSIKKFKEAL